MIPIKNHVSMQRTIFQMDENKKKDLKLLHPNSISDVEEALALEINHQEQKADFSTPPGGGVQLNRKPLDLSQFHYEDIQASDSQTIHKPRGIYRLHIKDLVQRRTECIKQGAKKKKKA